MSTRYRGFGYRQLVNCRSIDSFELPKIAACDLQAVYEPKWKSPSPVEKGKGPVPSNPNHSRAELPAAIQCVATDLKARPPSCSLLTTPALHKASVQMHQC